MITIKLFIISIIWINIKLITVFFVIIFFMINKESNDILNQKEFKINDRFTNFSLKPITFNTIPEPISIGTMFYYAYFNSVFDVTYAKILFGRKYFWLKQFSIKKIIRSLFFWYIGVSRLAILLIYKVIKYKDNRFENYLLHVFARPFDDRIIIRMNQKWEVNGGVELFWKKITYTLDTKISIHKLESIKPAIFKLYKETLELNNESRMFMAKFINIKTKIPHHIFPEAAKESKTWAYQTDFHKAKNNNFYDKDPLIFKYDGLKKKSTLIEENKNEFMQISEEKKTIITNQLKGAVEYGYDKSKLSEKYNKSIEDITEIKLKLSEILTSIDLDDEKIHKHIFEELTISTNIDMIELIEKDRTE